MKLNFVFGLMSLVLATSSVSAFAARPVPIAKRIAGEYAAQVKELGKKYSYDQTIEIYRKIRAKDEYATNAAARAYIAGEIIKQCRMPYWPNLKYWNPGLQAQIPVEAKAMLVDPELKFAEKVPFAAALSCHLASEDKDFVAAQRVLDDLRASHPQATARELAPLEIAYSNLYRWQDRFDEAWSALDRAVRGDAKAAGTKAISLAIDTGDWPKAHAIWAKGLGVAEELLALAGNERRPADTFAKAEAFVRDAKNPLADRLRIVVAYFCTDRSPRQRELRALVKDADKKKVSGGGAVLWAYQFAADYALALELEEYFGIVYTDKASAEACRRHILSLAAVGRKGEAAKFAAARAAVAGVKPEDLLKYRVLEAMLTGGDVGAVVASAKLPNLETAKLWRSAARSALTIGDMDAAERFSAAYLGCLAKFPARRMAVKYFDEPLASVADWRKIRGQLDPQLCDRKYGLSFEAMATDVATGREAIEASALDTNTARLELTTACDRFGLHIFMRVADPNALAVRDGFAGGITAETFLAPGRGEPYVCFGVSAAKGVEYSFQTMYDNATATRPDVDRKKGDDTFRLERVFAEGEYVVHLFFDWETYATKIPVNGSVWRLGCNARSAQGAYTWGGSNGPHETSAWGDLVFELSDKAVADIRRQALYKVRGRWRKTGRLDVFDTWANGGVGDADFAREVLAPLEKELAGLMDGVKPEMSDANVNRIFEQGYVRIQGLKHEIDRLRQNYLKRKLTEEDATGAGAVVENLPAGEVVLNETRLVGPEASGRTFRGAADGSTRISAGVAITGWTDRGGGVWGAKLPKGADGKSIYAECLFVNGRRAQRSRYPADGGFFHITSATQYVCSASVTTNRIEVGVDMKRTEGRILAAAKPEELAFAQLLAHVKWDAARYPIVSFKDGKIAVDAMPMKSYNKWTPGDIYALENVRGAFTEPGQWFYDGLAGEVLYRPLKGETIREAVVPAPGLETALAVRGAKDVTFENVTFAFTAPTGSKEPTRLAPYQAAALVSTAAVIVDDSTNVVFRNCRFEHLGSYALWFREGCRGGGAFDCEMTDLGAGGVRLGSHRKLREKGLTARPANCTSDVAYVETAPWITSGVAVENCLIAHGGRFHPAGVGVLLAHACDCSIAHNDIYDLYYTGVSVGWVWGYAGSPAQRNTIAFNHIRDIGQAKLADMGGIYLLGTAFGTCVSNNVIHGIHTYSYGGWGLYPDEGSEGLVLENNLVYDTDDSSFHQHYGKDNVLRNNILIDSKAGQIAVTRAEPHRSLTVERNVVLWTKGDAFNKYHGTKSEKSKIDWRGNLWWRTDGKDLFNGTSFADWRARVKDEGSVFADPGFADWRARDFSLKPDSPALKIGFKPFDPSLAGRRN